MNITINNSISEIELVHDHFTDYASNKVEDVNIIHKMSIVIDEILSNIISYGYQDGKVHKIHVTFAFDGSKIKLSFRDDGLPFNPLKKKIPEVSLVGDDPQVGGLGIKLVKNLADDFEYRRVNNFNQLQITKYVS